MTLREAISKLAACRLAINLTGTLVALLACAGAGASAIVPAPPQINASSFLLMDTASGEILAEENSALRLPPASLTKMMTSYIAATEIAGGRMSLSDKVKISKKAWLMEHPGCGRRCGSRMFIEVDEDVLVEDLLRGIVIQSGNDASVAIAEHISGDEEAFAELMKQYAERLGMINTRFRNSHGLPDDDHYTTAADLAKLATALITHHPEHYATYKERYYTFNNIRQANRNTLLWRDSTVDGVKTGHTEAAGYCLVASAVRDDMRLLSVVMGAGSEDARSRESQKLLTYGFRNFETVPLYAAGESLTSVRVWHGEIEMLELVIDSPVVLTLPRGVRESLTATLDINSTVEAPLSEGDVLGSLRVGLEGETIFTGDLKAGNTIQAAGFFGSVWDSISLFFLQLFGGDPLAVIG